jgi:lysophospholipase L1-like esterase
MPKHYKTVNGILHPRPFYSKKPIKFIINIIDNIIRHILKKIVILTQGWYQYFNTKEFLENYKKVINNLLHINKNLKIICISTVFCDDKIYNNSNKQYEIVNKGIETICTNNSNCYFIDIYNILKEQTLKYGWNKLYYKDHFHPNITGYKIISSEIIKKMEAI